MCGIVGFRGSAVQGPECHSAVLGALRALRHRGPDDDGIWLGNGAALGHRRLSILDISRSGHQPMCSPDGRYVMVYNGEVYNFRNLRRQLESKGRSFRSSGDSEVVLAALDIWGIEAALRRFIGMFAIALWDNAEKRLVLIRDRIGVKPLYYGWDGESLWFGSELKALRAFRHWQPEIDRTALAEYFRFGYINAPRSIYRNVFKLQPGHWLELKNDGEPVVRRYWSILDVLDNPLPGEEDALAEQLEELMVDALGLRMVSDVPVGMFLSGGIDSSLVTALLQKHHGDIHTFTIGSAEPNYDEAPHARRVAEYLGTHHTSHIVNSGEAGRIVPRWAELYDEPFADPSGIPTYLVSQLAAEHVKVVLSADGGDELFSGYSIYASMLRNMERRNRIPAPILRLMGMGMRSLPLDELDRRLASALRQRWPDRRRVTWRLRRVRDWLGANTCGEMYERTLGNFWGADETALLAGDSTRSRELADVYPGQFAEQMCLWDLDNYLPGDIFTKVDRATMAASIEGREPLVDHRIVEFAFRLPLNLRRGVLGSKHLLRKVLYKHVPFELVDRPKMGFGIPLRQWLSGDLAHLLDEHFDPSSVKDQGILNPVVVENTRLAFKVRNGDVTNKVWALLAFQIWRQRWA